LSVCALDWYNDYMSSYDAPLPASGQGPGPGSAPPIIRRKLAHEVLDRLLPRIRSGEFRAGDWLPSERELMRSLGVGRPAVREALQTLERMGLVSIVHGEGARVLALSADRLMNQITEAALQLLAGSSELLDHLKEARLQFEGAMVRAAAERATPQQVETLRALLEAHRASLDEPDRFLATDLAFHRGIAAVSGNAIYMAASDAMLRWMEQFHQETVRAPGAELATLDEHERIFRGIEQHDPQAAVEALTAHLERAHHSYRSADPLHDPERSKSGGGLPSAAHPGT
jgi:GntR family transcriptional regulator, sialic acid-inducible nan operon repressor